MLTSRVSSPGAIRCPHVSLACGLSNPRWLGQGSSGTDLTLLTAIKGKPRSRTLASIPCSADWSTISPERTAMPSSTLKIVSPSNHSDQRPSRCPLTLISYTVILPPFMDSHATSCQRWGAYSMRPNGRWAGPTGSVAARCAQLGPPVLDRRVRLSSGYLPISASISPYASTEALVAFGTDASVAFGVPLWRSAKYASTVRTMPQLTASFSGHDPH